MKTERSDEDARRAYWTEQMEAAYGFMDRILDYPVEDCRESLVSLPDSAAAEGLVVEFSRTRIAERHGRGVGESAAQHRHVG